MRIFLLLLLLPFVVYAQQGGYNFYKLDIYNGLSHNQVNAILKGPDGFLWFGTSSGLNRYDGYSFKIFRKSLNTNSLLTDSYISALYELPGGKMWVSTRVSPCIYDPHTEKFDSGYENYLHNLGLPPGNVLSIVKGQNSRYWFLYDSAGLYIYSAADKKAQRFKDSSMRIVTGKITAVSETKDGKLWMLYQNGFLQQYDIDKRKLVFTSSALQQLNRGNNWDNFFIDSDGDVWFWCFPYGLFLYHPQSNSVRQFNENSFPSRISSNVVSSVVQDESGLIWIATDHGGVTLIDKKNNFKTSYLLNDPKNPKSLGQNSIITTYKDDNGIIWLGTYKQGVSYLNDNIISFPYYHHETTNIASLQYDDVNRFAEDKAGNIWIGTNGGGLVYFNRKNNTFKQYQHDPGNNNSLANNVIVSLWIDHNGIVWIGTYLGGLDSFDGTKFTHYTHNVNDSTSLSDDKVWEIFEDSGQDLWIGTLGGGLDLLDRKTGRFKHYRSNGRQNDIIPSNFISAIMEDRKGNLWIGTDKGLAVIDKSRTSSTFYQSNTNKSSLSNANVICLLQDDDAKIWVGTRDGLNLFNEQTKNFHAFSASDGLPDNTILNILQDNHHTLWISTPNGLCSAVPKLNEKAPGLFIVNYDEKNNLQNREFNDNAALKTNAGELIFGGPSGFNIINPDKIEKPSFHPKIVFTGLQIFNKYIEPGMMINGRVLLQNAISQCQGIELKYKENVFSIEFAALDFAHNGSNKYAYMLEGFSPDWLYLNGTQRQVSYTNLDPGYYTFKVRVLNNNGFWSNIKSLKIHVEPPFWRTPVAYIIYAIVAAGLFLLARRITLDRIHMRFEVQQQRREVERAHAIEQLKTKFFTNVSHEFRTPLSLIITPLEKIIKHITDDEQKKQLNLVQRNAKRLLSLVNQLLDFRKMEVQEIKLYPSIGDIIAFSKDISQSFTDIAEKKNIQFSFSSNINSLEIYFDKDKIEKILFNLLSNAFKYTHDGGAISINLQYRVAINEGDGTLTMEIKDSGIGILPEMHDKIFERFFQTDVPQSMVNQGTGIGLAITKEFVKLHNGVITVTSEPEKGTTFSVLIPAKKVYEASARPASGMIPAEDEEQLLSEPGGKSARRQTIMIVEDNEDIRFYLKDNLKAHYHVEEAANGKDGWEKIKKLNPDLVVSDIMMPLMDGIELARKIKTETLTSHIPIILLTAKGSEEKQLEGYNVGINDYITKPFTFEILASRIRNLLAQKKLLQKRFQKQIEVNPEEITITPVDEKFLKQALELIEKNMDNPDFSVEEFSRDMYMNRVTLYRKILSLTGKTPIEFIRSIRLKRAAQLLEKSGMSVSEIAYEVGFNNPKHFSKFFKEEFKVLPSQYAENKKQKDG